MRAFRTKNNRSTPRVSPGWIPSGRTQIDPQRARLLGAAVDDAMRLRRPVRDQVAGAETVGFAVDGDFKLTIENKPIFEPGVRGRLGAVGAASPIVIERHLQAAGLVVGDDAVGNAAQ